MKNEIDTNIILIGFMGVGKSTIARALSDKLDIVSIDTDDLIETMHNKKIKKIFEENGEEYFRKMEQKVASWLEDNVKNTIISAGGGFFMVNNLKKIGKIIYLRSSFDGILKRINEHPNAKNKLAKRPLLASKKKAKELFDKREKKYLACADIIIDVEKHKTEKNILKEIIKNITKKDVL